MAGASENPAERQAIAADWFVEMYLGEASPERLEAFQMWVNEPANKAAFFAANEAWNATGELAGDPRIMALVKQSALGINDNECDVDAPIIDTGTSDSTSIVGSQRYASDSNPDTSGGYGASRVRHHALWGWAVAAAACVALFLALVPVGEGATVYATGIGERLVVTLDDGSVIELDAASQVAVSYNGSQRSLKLTRGRANFEVASDPDRPFSVAAGDKLFVAVGTEFSVELLGDQVRAVLYDGRLAVAEKDGTQPTEALTKGPLPALAGDIDDDQHSVIMGKGHQFIAPAKSPIGAGAVLNLPQASLQAGWREGRLEFADEPLPLAVARVNRYSHNKVVLDFEHARSVRVSGTFKAGQSAAFAEGVAELNGLKVVKKDGQIVLSK